MERFASSRAATVVVTVLVLGMALAVVLALRAARPLVLDAEAIGWLPLATFGVVAAASFAAALVALVAGLRTGALDASLRSGALAAVAGGALAAILADATVTTALVGTAALLLASALAARRRVVVHGRGPRIAAAGAVLAVAEVVALVGLLPVEDALGELTLPVLLGAAGAVAIASVLRSSAADGALAAGIAAIAIARSGTADELLALALIAAGALMTTRSTQSSADVTASAPSQHLPQLADQLSDGVLRFDGRLQLRDWNAAAAAFLGLDAEAHGTHLEDLLGVSLADLPPNEEVLARRTPLAGIELRMRRDDGGLTVLLRDPGTSPDSERLGRELRGTIEELLQARRTIELQRAEIERASTVDALTGVASRGAILERLRIEVAQGRRYAHPVAIIVVDVDGFTGINRERGLAGGDAVLREVALRIRLRVREADAIGRSGSDGFLAILPHTDEAGAATFADALRRRLAQRPIAVGGHELSVSVSVGVAVMRPGEEIGLDGLLDRAEEALDSARSAGGDSIALDRLHGLARLESHPTEGRLGDERAQDKGS